MRFVLSKLGDSDVFKLIEWGLCAPLPALGGGMEKEDHAPHIPNMSSSMVGMPTPALETQTCSFD